jgi:glutaredoxin-related protein
MKWMMVVLFVAGSVPVFGASITQSQIAQVQTTSQLLNNDVLNMQNFAAQVEQYAANNWQIQVEPGYFVTVSSTSVLATYTQLKTQMQTDFTNLP